jgi:hypothetical protein
MLIADIHTPGPVTLNNPVREEWPVCLFIRYDSFVIYLLRSKSEQQYEKDFNGILDEILGV